MLSGCECACTHAPHPVHRQQSVFQLRAVAEQPGTLPHKLLGGHSRGRPIPGPSPPGRIAAPPRRPALCPEARSSRACRGTASCRSSFPDPGLRGPFRGAPTPGLPPRPPDILSPGAASSRGTTLPHSVGLQGASGGRTPRRGRARKPAGQLSLYGQGSAFPHPRPSCPFSHTENGAKGRDRPANNGQHVTRSWCSSRCPGSTQGGGGGAWRAGRPRGGPGWAGRAPVLSPGLREG